MTTGTKKLSSEKSDIIIVGYGDFGNRLCRWLEGKGFRITAIIETDREKLDKTKELTSNPKTYKSHIRETILEDLGVNPKLIIDCSSRGQGEKNLNKYYKLIIEQFPCIDIKVIFQNGEEGLDIDNQDVKLYYPGVKLSLATSFYKVPLCSGLAITGILLHILNQGIIVEHLYSFHTKATNTARMLTPNYAEENTHISKITGIPLEVIHVNVTYLRGCHSYNNQFVYCGVHNLILRSAKGVSIETFLHNTIKILGTEIDFINESIMKEKLHESILYYIQDSLEIYKVGPETYSVNLETLTFTPEVNFPIIQDRIQTNS